MKIVLKVVICLLIVIALIVILFRKNITSYDDINKYEKYLENLRNNSDAHSKLLIFPDTILKDNVEDFQYLTVDGLFDGSYLFYIVINYSEDDLQKEVERIKNIKLKYNNEIKTIISEEKSFKYPTYITICDGLDTYEYVMIDNNKVIYVFRQLFDYKNSLNKNYILKYIVPSDKKDKYTDGYNMYYFYDKYGIGHMDDYDNL